MLIQFNHRCGRTIANTNKLEKLCMAFTPLIVNWRYICTNIGANRKQTQGPLTIDFRAFGSFDKKGTFMPLGHLIKKGLSCLLHFIEDLVTETLGLSLKHACRM